MEMELFLECYSIARKKSIRCKMKKTQAVMVITFVAFSFFIPYLIGYRT